MSKVLDLLDMVQGCTGSYHYLQTLEPTKISNALSAAVDEVSTKVVTYDMAKIASIVGVTVDTKGEYPFEILDTKDSLVLIHYNPDAIGKYPLDSRVRDLRGIIVDLKTEQIVCSSFGYIPTATVESPSYDSNEKDKSLEIEDNHGFKHSIKDVEFQSVIEGAMIRVWKHDETLMFSTHKRIDCSTSHWGSSKNFLDLFREYTKSVDFDTLVGKDTVLYFILVNKDLILTSDKYLFGSDGTVVYICARNPLNMSISDDENKRITDTLKTKKVNFVKKSDVPLVNETIVTYTQDGKRKAIRLISPELRRRIELVDNDPNILHRMYTLNDMCQAPKKGEKDNYFEIFKRYPILSPSQANSLKTNVTLSEDLSTVVWGQRFTPEPRPYTVEELTFPTDNSNWKTIAKVHERRVLNAIMNYAFAISSHHQLKVFQNISTFLTQRNKLIKILQDNYEKFSKGDFEGYPKNKKSEKVFKHTQSRISNAVNYARKNPKLDSGKLDYMIKHNVMSGVMKDTGKNVYSMVKLFVKE